MDNQIKLAVGGTFTFEAVRDGKTLWVETIDNIVTNEGLDYILDTVVNATAQKASWYVGLFTNNYTPVATVTAATIAAASGESVAYNEATRVGYVGAAAAGQSVTNTANRSTFTININSTTIYGGFLCSEALKAGVNAGATDVLLAATQFGSAKTLDSGDQLLVTYAVGASSA